MRLPFYLDWLREAARAQKTRLDAEEARIVGGLK